MCWVWWRPLYEMGQEFTTFVFRTFVLYKHKQLLIPVPIIHIVQITQSKAPFNGYIKSLLSNPK